MSFTCDNCSNPQPVRTTPISVVTKKRHVSYSSRKDSIGNVDDGGVGWEIVVESKLCTTCAKRMSNE